jgi:hypothetical protein
VVGLVLNREVCGDLVDDGPGVAWHDGWGGVDLVDEQGPGAGNPGFAGLLEGDGDRLGGEGDEADGAADVGFPGDGAVFVVSQVGVELAR